MRVGFYRGLAPRSRGPRCSCLAACLNQDLGRFDGFGGKEIVSVLFYREEIINMTTLSSRSKILYK